MTLSLPPAVDTDETDGRRVFHIGPYRLAERVGEGAMGAVYRAVHSETGVEVALKTARNTRQSAVASIRREIDILEQLDHPGIVGLHDQGTSRGIPWFAMELLDGPTLYALLARAAAPFDSQIELGAPATATRAGLEAGQPFGGPGIMTRPVGSGSSDKPKVGDDIPRRTFDPERARPLLLILIRLCRTLSYLHNEGVVHRDLKPSNVFLREGLQGEPLEPVLVDFGVVGWFEGADGRERLTGIDRRRFAGTLQYMAPEQLRGELVDARADLYAVGCILYAALVGKHPFVARTPQEVIRRHIDGDYTAPGDLVDGLPDDLVMLIDKLLASHPGRRIGHADSVATTLERVLGEKTFVRRPAARAAALEEAIAGDSAGRGAADIDELSSPDDASARVRSVHLNKPGFVGRKALFERTLNALLEAASSKARARRSTLLLVGGHSGSGKTRLAMELGAAAENAGLLVTTECSEAGLLESTPRAPAEPLGVFRSTLQVIADHCRERGAEETSQIVGRRASVLAQYEPSLADLPGRSRRGEPVELPARAARVRTFTYLTETLAAFSQRQPLLIIIDDLHLADELSLGFLSSLLRSGGVDQTMVLATYRLEESSQLGALFEHGQVDHVELDALDRDDIASLVGDMLVMRDPPNDFVERIAALSMGNPFAVSEYVHAAVEQGLLARAEDGTWRVDPVLLEVDESAELLTPSRRLASVIEGRLECLEPVERRLVELACVSTRRLDPELLGELAGLSTEELEAAIEHLCMRRIFEENAGRVRLVEQVRRVAYRQLSKNQSRRACRRLARALERRGGDKADVLHLLELWRGAGVGSRELCYVEKAAETALVRGTPSAARGLLQRGLRLVNQLDERAAGGGLDLRRARLERLLAMVHWSSGEVDFTISLLERSLSHLGFALPESTSDWCADATLQAARQIRSMVWPPQVSPGQALEAERLEQGLESGIALLWPMMLRGNTGQTITLASTLANMSDRLGSGQRYALPFAVIAGYCQQFGLASLASFYESRARENLDQSTSVPDFIGATRLFSYWACARGDWEQVDRLVSAALTVSEEVGDMLGHESMLINGAIFALFRDHIDEARELLQRAERLGPLGGSEMKGAWSRVVEAMIARQEGDTEGVLALIEGQIERFSQMSEKTGLAHALCLSAISHCESGRHGQGFRLGEQALEVFEALSGGRDRNVVLYHLYEWLPSLFRCSWRSGALGDKEHERALGHLRTLVARFEKLARFVPAARAASLRHRGVLTAIDGDLAGASALLSRSIAEAKCFDLAYQDRLTRQVAVSLGDLASFAARKA